MDSNLNSNNKRSANDINDYQDTNNVKRTRSNKLDLRFLLASRKLFSFVHSIIVHLENFLQGDAGAIIGRQGKNIQMLRSKYKTIIQVPVRIRCCCLCRREERVVFYCRLGSRWSRTYFNDCW